jgi:hypothetical protein
LIGLLGSIYIKQRQAFFINSVTFIFFSICHVYQLISFKDFGSWQVLAVAGILLIAFAGVLEKKFVLIKSRLGVLIGGLK